MASQACVTELLEGVSRGSQSARDDLMVVVYDELRRLAGNYMRRERRNHTLQPTALVHEAYLRLVGQEGIRWQNREHFIGVAAMMMRRVLVNYANSHKQQKRGGGDSILSLREADFFIKDNPVDLLALDVALKKLALTCPRECQIVELRYFGGLTIDETAKVLDISSATVERDWHYAKMWLLREMSGK